MIKTHKNKKLAISLALILFTSNFAVSVNTNNLVEIKRDNYGVPHIYADTTYDLFYGYGYAVAEDRLFQTDMARRSFIGSTAEVLGRGEKNEHINYDINVRKNYLPDSISNQLDNLSTEERAIFKGYADGFNAYLKKIEENPELMPIQYDTLGFLPAPISDFDVLMIWTGSMANRFSDVNLEIMNLSFLNRLIEIHGNSLGTQVFNEFFWINDPSSPSTVPQDNKSEPSISTNPIESLEIALSYLQSHNSHLTQREVNRQLLSWGGVGPDFVPRASNIWITSPHKTHDKSTILINGPQFGWYNPSYVYGIGLHGAGYNVVGNTPFAYPAILFATNGTIAWGATAGPQDVVDIYQEQLNDDNPYEYLYNNSYRAMDHRSVTINIKNEEPEIVTFFSTIHGPIIDFDLEKNIAYSKKRSWSGYEAQSLLAWVESMKSQNWEDYQNSAKKVAISINWYYADKSGNIGYLSPGFLPNRPEHQDMRIPAIGDGSMEWKGILDFNYTPKSYNPTQGYLVNWNNLPAPNKQNTDAYYWTYGDRVNELDSLYKESNSFSQDDLWEFNETASYKDVNWRYFNKYLLNIAQSQEKFIDESTSKMLSFLLSWDGNHHDQDNNGLYDHPGSLIFKTWLEELYKTTLLDWVPLEYQNQYKATGFSRSDQVNPGSVNLSMGTKIILRQLMLHESGTTDDERLNLFNGSDPMDLMREALSNTFQRLMNENGPDIASWTYPVSITTFSEKNFTGTLQSLPSERIIIRDYQNRGTENNRIIFTDKGVQFCDVVAPGQSGFITKNGIKSNHYEDQIELFFNFKCKPQYISTEDVDKATKSITRIITNRKTD